MQKKMLRLGILVLGIAASGLWTGLSNAENQLQAPEKELIIEGEKPARFLHSTHLEMGLTCEKCHHDDKGSPFTAEAIGALPDPGTLRCVSCHNAGHPDEKLQSAKDVFHAKCKDCHKAGYNGKKGPGKCSSCHVKDK